MEDSKKIYKITLRSGLIACVILAIGFISSFWIYRYCLKNAVAESVSQEKISEFFAKSLEEKAMLKTQKFFLGKRFQLLHFLNNIYKSKKTK